MHTNYSIDSIKAAVSEQHLHAISYLKRGFKIIPIISGTKKPRMLDWSRKAFSSELEINFHWSRFSEDNIALLCGSQFTDGTYFNVIDIDNRKKSSEPDANQTLAEFEERFGGIPLTPTVKTPSGGFHFYLRSYNPIRKFKPMAKVDIQGLGSYVLAPPSLHPNGLQYVFDEYFSLDDTPIASHDLSFGNMKKPTGSMEPSILNNLFCEDKPDGQRNNAAAQMCGYLLRRYVDPRVTLEILNMWNQKRCRPPLSNEEIRGVVSSILKKELVRRSKNQSRGNL